jgi:hypothetical protein
MGISSSAVLVELNVSVWPATKKDKRVTEMVNDSANAVAGASETKKHLFAGTSLRKDIENFAARIRLYHSIHTMPWADKGERLLPSKILLDYKQVMNVYKVQFDAMCEQFFDNYNNLVAEAPLHLGALYDPTDYPPLEEVKEKFGFRLGMKPLPQSGDFRLDIPAEDLAEMKKQYDQQYEEKLADAMKSAWTRLYDLLKGMSEKLTDEGEAKKRWHDSFVTNATDMCDLLGKLNITNDPELEKARRALETAMVGIEIEDIKESAATRSDVKARVDDILSKFNW